MVANAPPSRLPGKVISTYQEIQDKLLLQGGLFVFALLALVPVFNCIQLLSDTNLSFWVGSGFAWGWMMLCVGLVCFYFITVTLYVRMAPVDDRRPSVAFMIFRTFVGLLGLLLIAQSFPIERQTGDTAEMLTLNCEAYGRASSLHSYYHRLKAIRTDESCKGSFSVEQCAGWQSTEYNDYIFWVENHFHCANICPESVARLSPIEPPPPPTEQGPFMAPTSRPELQPIGTMPAVADATAAEIREAENAGPTAPPAQPAPAQPAALALGKRHRTTNLRHVDHVTPLGEWLRRLALTEKFARQKFEGVIAESLSLFEAGSSLQSLQEQPSTTSAAASAGLLGPADAAWSGTPNPDKKPNALFSRAHYEHRCGLMIAMDIRNRGKALSDATFANGIALFMVMIFSAALQLGVECSKGRSDRQGM